MDFTIDKFEELLKVFLENEISVYGIQKWVSEKPKHGILLRHDIDRKPQNAVKIAQLEKDLGISSTYYFRIVPSCFKPEIIKTVHEMGHEIGYHYEDLSLANGNYEKAIKLFEQHLSQLRDIVPVHTIAMHGRVQSKHDNRDLWNNYDFKKFGIIAEAFLSIDYHDLYYFTDTGRKWNSSRFNVRDKVEGKTPKNINSTNELADYVKAKKDQKISIVCHPERWDNNLFDWLVTLARDTSFNLAKLLFKQIHLLLNKQDTTKLIT